MAASRIASFRRPRTPKYRRQKEHGGRKDRAFVDIDGKRIPLGEWNTPASREEYDRLIAEWLSNGRHLPPPADDRERITVEQVIAQFWLHAQKHYRKPDGTPTTEIENLRQALRPLRKLYASMPAADFGPLALKALREHMIGLGWARTHINRQIARIKLVFKRAVENELVPPSVYQGLQAAAGLKLGRTDAKESKRVVAVGPELINPVRELVSRQVRALIDLQLYSGARPGELLKLRPIDIDMTVNPWEYCPESHKTAHRGSKRIIWFGTKVQEVLRTFLAGRPTNAYLFSPREAGQERYAEAEIHRRENQKPNAKRSEREVGDHYTRHSYHRAIVRACDRANSWAKGGRIIASEERVIPRWHPHQLRHAAATNLRREFGIDVAQTVLGHKIGAQITELYAEPNVDAAKEAVLKIG